MRITLLFFFAVVMHLYYSDTKPELVSICLLCQIQSSDVPTTVTQPHACCIHSGLGDLHIRRTHFKVLTSFL